MTLRKKIFFVSLVFTLGLSLGLSYTFYLLSKRLLYSYFLESSVVLSKSLAGSMDGDLHASFNSEAAIGNRDYQRSLQYLHRVRKSADHITYIYSLNYDEKSAGFTYAIDSEIAFRDAFWLESPELALAVRFDDAGRLAVEHNQKVHDRNFTVSTATGKIEVGLDNADGAPSILIGGVRAVRFLSRDPMEVETPAGRFGRSRRSGNLGIAPGGRSMKFLCTYTQKGRSGSDPGVPFTESADYIARCRNYFLSGAEGAVDWGIKSSIYGDNAFSIFSVIKNAQGVPRGLLVMDLYNKSVAGFRRAMAVTAIGVFGASFLLTFLLSWVLSEFVTRPVRRLTSAVKDVARGDLSTQVDIGRSEEFRVLSRGFNSMTAALREYTQSLVEMDRLKDEFLANTSHELKTPLNGIIGIAQSLVAGAAGDLSEAQRRNVEMIAVSGRRLYGLVNEILDFSRLKNDEMKVEISPVDVRASAELVLAFVAPIVAGRKLEIRNDISGIPLVLADENRLQQILLNLVENAIKFTEEGSIRISAREEDGSVAVTVSDTGIGIEPDRQEKIFLPFEQADGSISRRFGGTGLGLSIAQRLLRLQGGDLKVESRPGEGSRFTFLLPAAPAGTGAPVPAPGGRGAFELVSTMTQSAFVNPPEPAGEAEYRVLAVDDDPVNLQVLANELSLGKYTVTLASSGEEALERIGADGEFDLVILDIMMPRISGFEVAAELRRRFPLFELPIIMLTAKNQIMDIVTGFEAGANDYIPKPFNRRELLARVGTLIALKHAVRMNNRLLSLKNELDVALKIQNSTLPREPLAVPGVRMAFRYEPMESVGGDFLDFFRDAEGGLGIVVADVTGHGLSASIIAAMLKMAVLFERHMCRRPDMMLEELNRVFHENFREQFISVCAAYLEPDLSVLRVSLAGHPPILVRRGDTGELAWIKPRGKIISCFENSGCELAEVPVRQGDRLVFYTDGITEGRNSHRILFEAEFEKFVRESGGLDPDEFCDALIRRIKAWCGGKENIEDDLTLLVIDILAEGQVHLG